MNVPTSSSSSTSKTGFIQESAKGVFLLVRVQPNASKNTTDGVANGRLKVRLCAKAVDNAANDALIELLSDLLGIRKSALTIESGLKAREKRVRVEGMGATEVEKILNGAKVG